MGSLFPLWLVAKDTGHRITSHAYEELKRYYLGTDTRASERQSFIGLSFRTDLEKGQKLGE